MGENFGFKKIVAELIDRLAMFRSFILNNSFLKIHFYQYMHSSSTFSNYTLFRSGQHGKREFFKSSDLSGHLLFPSFLKKYAVIS